MKHRHISAITVNILAEDVHINSHAALDLVDILRSCSYVGTTFSPVYDTALHSVCGLHCPEPRMVNKVPQQAYETLKRIVSSDVAHVLHLIPSYNALRIRYGTTSKSHFISLYVGQCDGIDIWITSDGMVKPVVARAGKHQVVLQNDPDIKPLNEHFKPIKLFPRNAAMKIDIHTEAGPSIRALTLMYMYIWAANHDTSDTVLPPLVYDDLRQALLSLQEAAENDILAPKMHLKAEGNDEKMCLEPKKHVTPLQNIAKTEAASPTKNIPEHLEDINTAVTDVKVPASESYQMDWNPGAPQDNPVVLSTSYERVIPAQYQASANALMARLYRRRE
jgi:hypothetical protein